jgi:hypothetical protein
MRWQQSATRKARSKIRQAEDSSDAFCGHNTSHVESEVARPNLMLKL